VKVSKADITRAIDFLGRELLLLALIGCDRRAPIATCDQDLSGEYVAGDRTWMIVDRGEQLDIYPLFRDVPSSSSPLEVAPRTIELFREGVPRGHTQRRYMQGANICIAKVPATIARCADDVLEVVHAETAPPLGFTPCQWGRTDPARVERWTRR
jgi:hypothetical protein